MIPARKSPLRPWTLYAALALLSLLTSALTGARLPAHLPRVHDEFSYLLAGQTFSHFQLTNPTPPLWRFFESHHELMVPTMMSKYPPGQGLALALGYWLGAPIYGVWLSGALFVVSLTWMLRGFFPSRWACLGGVLAIGQFGFTHYWAQSFWGGALAAAGGAFVIGGCRRLWRAPRPLDAAVLGFGIVVLAFTRPFEGLLACVIPTAVLVCLLRRSRARAELVRTLAPGAAVVVAGLAFLGYYHFRVTGSPFHLPYFEYEHRYAGTPYFVWQAPRPAPEFQTPALAAYYREYMVPLSHFHGDPLYVWPLRIFLTARNFLGPLLATLAVLGLVLRPRGWSLLALASLLVCSLAMILSYWISSHYQAVAASLYLFLVVAGARVLFLKLPRPARVFAPAAALLLAAQSCLLWRDPGIERDLRLRLELPQRARIIATLTAAGGRHLIFVQPVPPFNVHASWVFNDLPFGSAPVLWAWDHGDAEDQLLVARFPDRQPIRMRVSDDHVEFVPFSPAAAAR